MHCMFDDIIKHLACAKYEQTKSTITKKMAAVYFPSNALQSKIFKKTNGCLLKDRRKAEGRYCISLFSNFQLTLAMHPGKMYMPPSFP